MYASTRAPPKCSFIGKSRGGLEYKEKGKYSGLVGLLLALLQAHTLPPFSS